MLAPEVLNALSGRLDQPALGCKGVDWTGRQCLSYVVALRAQLRAAGMSSGSRLMVANQRGNYYWLDFIALWSMGSVGVRVEQDAVAGRLHEVMEDVSPGIDCGVLTEREKALALGGLWTSPRSAKSP